MILPISQGGLFGAITVDVKVCIGDTPHRKYMPKYIKPMSNRNKIKCGCETCICAMLLQLYLDKWSISSLVRLYKLCINYVSTRILQRSKNDFIEYNNEIILRSL